MQYHCLSRYYMCGNMCQAFDSIPSRENPFIAIQADPERFVGDVRPPLVRDVAPSLGSPTTCPRDVLNERLE